MWFRRGRIMERGDFKYLLLDALKDTPMHGYEIMKVVSEKYGGFYIPSPGVVYPTLQMLEDVGHVTSRTEDGKKVYSITAEGRKFLAERKPLLENVFQRRREFFKSPKADLIKEGRRLRWLLFRTYGELTDSKAEEISKILADAAEKIEAIVSK